MIKKTIKGIYHTASGNRKFYYNELKKLSAVSDDRVVLELGSGKVVNGKYAYSAKHLFPTAKEFICTDINPKFGHKVVDVTKMKQTSKYDVILCLNVLEHVFEFQKAVDNMHKSLKKNGTLCIAVPFVFPMHDEPHDYWRFTEHSLRRILKDFSKAEVKPQRSRKLPTGYFVIAVK